MLVLGRKAGESIIIGDSITVKIVSVDGDHVKIGIEAPRHVQIHRQEIYETIQQENQLAGSTKPNMPLERLRQLGLDATKGDKHMKIEKKE
ncbi:carbon storage regulator CsrA [Aneurinibacillus soli]|uniref:Translational regulator CsrA n=1 Tax=Aneurinibacillus soli TaxID=1500254 RepID=A0A0U5AX37_9BACL|nr:carbon storage regulator CsrA [Aneurinibacillus soli]PYE61485.1 carbon storage regulator CsrA [Aneurinibacillus soli]BAU26560.1 hypothetical protein CB4_00687 [Aneurinibacillus soli]